MNERGQALLEFSAAALVSVLALTGGGRLLYAQWERAHCAYLAFEGAHRALVRGRNFSARVLVSENAQGIRAQAQCSGAREQVELPWLEEAKW
ncbi:MAG: hypothetical protein ACXWP5_11865 [Bdellovibrionota bacterium]